ncbi:MAG: alpha/beta hydrolase [Alteromonadaceae bacterium]|nr:alpha/beta hydrolase [Alteromonadaceae bacterium]
MKEKIFFIPGTMCDIRLWDELWLHLENAPGNDYQLIHVPIPKEDTMGKILSQLYCFINEQSDHLNIEKDLRDKSINLLGFSLGGYLASAFYASYPDKVKKMFNASNTPCILPEAELLVRQRIIAWIEVNGYSGLLPKRASELLHQNNKQNNAIIDKMRAMDKALGEEVLLQQYKVTTEREDLFTGLLKADIPITFCHGVEDSLVNSALFDKMPANNTLIQHIEISGAGHMLPLEQPEAMAKAILLWLEK